MTIRVAINGFGRLGRLSLRAGWDSTAFDVIHINEVAGDATAAAHLLEFDSVHGYWDKSIRVENQHIIIDDKAVSYSQHDAISDTDWKKYGIDMVIECTNQFKSKTALAPYKAFRIIQS